MTRRGLVPSAAVALLDISLAFQNVWPTPMIRWAGELSVECGVFLILVIAAQLWLGPLSRTATRCLAAAWIVLVVGHYADVTTPALYGRDINLYWDVRYMPDVAAMIARAAPLWLLVCAAAAVAAVLALLYAVFRWAIARVAAAAFDPRERAPVFMAGVVIVGLFAAQQFGFHFPTEPTFATPVVVTYARQARLVAGALSASKTLPPSPPLTADLAQVRGADVFLIFIESYGSIAYERPDMAPALAKGRADLAAAIRDTHRDVVSAYVESPTFGGSSWLAHLSLMSGVEVRDPETNARLMTEPRDTMVTTFKRAGHRTIALMPGLRQAWPEGAFYRFDDIYGASRLDYRGPEFGWFAVPDQFTLAKFDALERSAGSAAPLFVFFPTISTHFPFIPTPPYQPDWTRIFDEHPYDGPSIVRAYAQQPDWTHFGAGYVQAIAYDYATLAGYLRLRADRDLVMILLGDHEPAAAVSGEGAPWDVPVHVIASRPQILDALSAHGFRAGLVPARPSLGKMHTLLPTLLDAFSSR
ncbi:MAG: sulfatase family protein [Acidobacteria bacterium]|nr:sulfatase family protein [Acidobacteriota bacterium]